MLMRNSPMALVMANRHEVICYGKLINKSINTRGREMRKYIVGKNQKHLIVSEDVHETVRMYAEEKQLTMVEATFELLRIAFSKVYGLELDKE